MEKAPETTVWKPLDVLKSCSGPKTIALVVLNRPLEPLRNVLDILWHKAMIKVAVDGGAFGLEAVTKGNNIPDIITGDFDSCPLESINRFRQRGVEIIETPDQDFTDFTKCLKVVATRVNDSKESIIIRAKGVEPAKSTTICGLLQTFPSMTDGRPARARVELKAMALECEGVVVLGAFGGRLDHVMANINTLFETREFLNKPVVLFSKESVAILLKPGRHKIEVQTGLEAEWCGLVPVGGPCRSVTTTGLKWNLSDGTMRFGELISTSNTYDGSGVVTVVNSDPLLWTMGYNCSAL